MPKWLDHLEEQAKRAAKAVTPDVVEHAASAVVNNPVTQAVGGPVVTGAVSSMFGPAAPIISNVGQGLGILPTVPGSSAVTNPIASYMTQYGPPQAAQQAWQQGSLRPLTQLPGGLAQLATGAGGYLAGVPQRSVDYFGGEFKDNIARNTVNFAQHPGLRSGAGLLEAWFDPSFQIANNPVRDVHAYSGGTAYYVATHGGQLPSGGAAMPFNHAADWAREHPEEWGNIAKAYEQGYNGYKGDRAVWEYYIGKQDRSVRILADVTNDPWNATLLAGFLEKSLGKAAAATASYSPEGAKAIEAFAKTFKLGDRVTQELMGLPLKPIELPLKGGAALLARTEAGQAIGRGVGRVADFLHLGETEGSKANRAANEAGNVVGNLGDQTVTQQQLPSWATPLDGTGKYEAVLADRDSGASYIVDPEGNPVPGSALEGKRSNRTNRKTAEAMNQPDYEMDPRTRQTAEKWNTEGGGRPGVTTNPTNGFAPVTGENTITNNGTSPFPEAPAAAALPTPATNTLPANAPANGPAATVGQPTEGITPAHFQQTQGQRRASVNEGMSVAAPNIGDTRLSSEVERLRAEKPDQAQRFYAGIGLDPATGSAVPGTPAGNLMDTLSEISSRYYDDASGGLLHKVADEKLAALRFTVLEEAPLFATTMERSMRPRLSAIGQTGVDELIADLAGRKPDRGVAGLLETIVLSPSETDAAKAARALLDTRQPWLDDAVRDAQSLRTQAQQFPAETAQTATRAIPATTANPLTPAIPADDPRRVPMDFWQEVKPPTGRRPGETLAEWTARVNARGNEANVRGTTLFDDVLDSEAIAANKFQPVAPTYDRLGISPLDAEGSTPFPELAPPSTADDVMGVTPTPNADEGVPAAVVEAAGGPPEDPAVVTLLDELHQRGVVDDTERDYLQKVYPGMDRPLLEEILTRQRQGMSTRDIQNDIRGAIYRSGRPASQAKKTVAKATGAIADVRAGKQQAILDGTDRSLVDAIAQGASTFSTNARQSQQYNILNLVPGGLGDIAGNAMHFQQTGDIRGLGRFLSPNNLFLMLGGETKVASRFTPEADDLLAGFNRAMPEHIMPKAGEAGLTRYGHNDQTLVLWGKAEARAARKGKNVPIWQKAPLHAIQSPWSQSFRTGIDLSSRGVRFTTSLDNQLDGQLAGFADELTAAGLPAEQTIDAIRRHATEARAPKAFTTANPNGVLRSFEPEDVRAITGSEDLTRKWRSRQNSMYRQAAKDTNTTFFTDAKRYGVDDALSKVFFYHFWQSRALALQARSMLRNPRVMGQYYRMIQGAMNEADQKGYPQTFRGLLHYMGDEQGFYGLFNPLGVLVPAMMFGDLASQQGEGNLDRLSSILPINPLITGAAAALGLTDDIPNLFGTTRVQNMVAGIINYGRAHGIDFGRNGLYRDPVSHWTQRVFELVNQKAGKAISGKRYEPYDPQSGKLDTIRSIIYHQAETDFGPADQWTPEQWQEVGDAMDALDVGGAGNDRADAAFAAYSDANMRNLVMGSILPQGSVLRYGPRETARNDAKISDGSLAAQAAEAAGQTQRDIVQASPETRHILIGQQQLAQLGTERQQNLYSDWNAIVYGPDSAGPAERQNYVTVQGRNVTIAQLQEMTTDQRILIANAYTAEQGGTQELSQYRDARKAAIASNPALASYDEYKKTLDEFTGGVRGYRAWAASVSPEYAKREQERRAYLQSRGGTGAVHVDASGVHVSEKSNDAIEAELDDWAFSTDAYTAFSGKQGDLYDAKPLGGADTSNDPMAALRAGAGTTGQGSGGSGSGGDSLASRLDRAIASYQQQMAAYQASGGPNQQLPGMFGQGQQIMYGQMPQPSADLARYILWANRQPPGSDTSTQAYEAWVTANTPVMVGQ